MTYKTASEADIRRLKRLLGPKAKMPEIISGLKDIRTWAFRFFYGN